MAKPRQPKLKVFQAQFGFFDTVVAAPSQAAALSAWGARQNLFASGDARTTEDEAAVAAALEHPGTPLRRAVGSNDPFQLKAASLPSIPAAPKRTSAKTPAKIKAAPKPAADRSALDAAEAALREIEEAARKRKRASVGGRTSWTRPRLRPRPATSKAARRRPPRSWRRERPTAPPGATTNTNGGWF